MNTNNKDIFSEERNTRIRMPVCNRLLNTEITNDYVLPDYYPEIRRVLHIFATVMPPAKYVNGNSIELNGTIEYNVLYVGIDGELYTAPLSTEYELNIPFESEKFDLSEGVSTFVDNVVENIAPRLMGPRKINIKSRLRSNVSCYAIMMFNTKFSGDANQESLEKLIREEDVCTALKEISDVFEKSEEIILDNQYSECRIISASGEVFISDINSKDGSVSLKGYIYIDLLIDQENSITEPIKLNRKVPFSYDIDSDEFTYSSHCCAKGYISNLNVNTEEGKITCDICTLFEIDGQQENKFEYICDVYSTQKESTSIYEKYELPTKAFCKNGNFSVNEHLSKESINLPPEATIIDVYSKAIADTIESSENKKIITGSIKYTLILLNNGEYSSIDIVLPTKYEFEDDNAEMASSSVNFSVISCRARQDTDTINIDSEIAVKAIGFGKTDIKVAEEVLFDKTIDKKRREITVCYPSENDTLWSVAKRYHTPIAHLEELNGTEPIEEKNYILI